MNIQKRYFVLAAILVLAPFVLTSFHITLLNYIGLYAIVALGIVMLTGVAGQVSFGQAAFVGLAAYTSGVLTTQYAQSPWLGLVVGIAITLAVAYVLGFITLRMSGHYLPVATIAWGMSLYYLFGNSEALGLFTGFGNIPPLKIFAMEVKSERSFYWLIWLAVMASVWLSLNILNSRSGRAIRALKGRGIMAESVGVDTAQLKISVFLYAAFLAAIAGWLYAHFQRYVNPTSFSLNWGVEFLFMAVVGGAGYVWGALLGAALITILKHALQSVLPKLLGQEGNFELVVFGLLIVLLLHKAREGLWPYLAKLTASYIPVNPLPIKPAAALVQRDKPTGGEMLLAVKQAEKRFGGLIAVNKISFDLKAGELVGLIGPNGAGKSTMFNLITGVAPVTSGEIFFRGQRINTMASRKIAKLGIARTFQHVKLLPQMTVLENVAIGAYQRANAGLLKSSLRLDRDEEAAQLQNASRQLARLGLSAEIHELAGNLPLGKQRILEIARALAADPVLLLLDEPAAGLRYREKVELAKLLNKLRAEGMSILMVEHDMEFVMSLADRLVVMSFGAKLAEGRPQEVQQNPLVQEAYLGGVA
jgi:ABC-type branched-subunit amino acid transport system ATPase component/ABC-type branched-subunit amino acid transport system permease subunit